MKTILDIENWNRKEHFYFFKQFEEPFFGMCANIDCTIAYESAKSMNVSFFLYYIHKSLVAANSIETMKYRIEGEEVVIYNQIDPSITVNRPDKTFGFSYIKYSPDFNVFLPHAQEVIEKVRNNKGLDLSHELGNVIHYSVIPWVHFTSLSHARSFSYKSSVPKISFGKIIIENNKRLMPMSIHVHHALVDGFDVGLFYETFQNLMNEKPMI